MDLSQLEYTMRHIRGRNVGFYAGDRALTDAEGAALLAAHERAYGPGQRPAYVSPDGWQVFAPEQKAAPATSEEAGPAAVAAPAPHATSKHKRG